jgi:acyl-homoserine lactone acylase PvdQ
MRIEETKKTIAELEEIIRLSEAMQIDVSEYRIKLNELKAVLKRYEDGLNRYVSQRASRSK